jgi:uncharacterized OB-fold protein
MPKLPDRIEETLDGQVVFRLPFPKDLTHLKDLAPIVLKQPYSVTYLHSYGQDSPFFAALTNKLLLGTKCQSCGYTFATPRLACMECGGDTEWLALPDRGKVHCFTVCHFGSEEFLPECPFVLALVEFPGVNSLFLTRLMGVDPAEANLGWIGMEVAARFKRNAKLRPTDVYFVPASA